MEQEKEDAEVKELKELLEDYKQGASDPPTSVEKEAIENIENYIDETKE